MNPNDDFSSVEPDADETIKDPRTGKTISRKRAFVLAAGAMMTGAALNDLKDAIEIPEILPDGDGNADTVLTDSNNDGADAMPAEPGDETATAESPAQQVWNPNTAPMAGTGTVSNDMSFSEAFSAAREELGAGGVFEWQGQYYNTFYAEELDDNNQPVVEYEVTEHHDLNPTDYSAPVSPEANTYEQADQGGVNTQADQGDAEIDAGASPQVMAADFDMDGNVDAVYADLNQDSSADIVYADLNQDGQIADDEFVVIHDPENLDIPEIPSDGSMMSVDNDYDGIDDFLIADVEGDQVADVIGIDENKDQLIEQSEITVLNPDALEGTDFGAVPVEYSGEISTDMPEDVPEEVLDDMPDDMANLEDNFDEINNWS